MLSVLLLRVGIEVFCAIIEIAQNTRRSARRGSETGSEPARHARIRRRTG